MLAYGQTGSGKTFTISGLLDLLAADLFTRQAEVSGWSVVQFTILSETFRRIRIRNSIRGSDPAPALVFNLNIIHNNDPF
jgi:hypothetical protein